MKVVVLCSGGLDSVTALHAAARSHEILAVLSAHYGARHNDREIPFAARHAAALGLPHRIVSLAFVAECFTSALLPSGAPVPEGHYEDQSMRQTVVPFRNALLLSVATGLAESIGAEAVVIAAHGGDHAIYPDCREAFMRAMDEAMRLGTYPGIRLLRPFIDLDKAGIVRRAAALGVDLGQTWSCYRGQALHCGACGTCIERREAFQLAGVPDPTPYQHQPPLPPRPPPHSGE
ncbi:MAG: 7-cyano-7-deazaguanine synthase QueC [Puniceicoccaceae bacterium]|nr:MAG: 7-cyano-7-deazaguanine synthase QueC [Puniceicoccaceae bacterium]